MPAISKIRFTNVIYEEGMKRYNDETFLFDGQNGAVLLENGGGKTVFIQTALQAVLPHTDLGERKLKQTLKLDEGPAHIAIEWIIKDNPRQYAVTAVSLYLRNNQLDSVKFAFDYGEQDQHRLDTFPFTMATSGGERVSSRQEVLDYYGQLMRQFPNRARTFQTIRDYQEHLEQTYQIITNEWKSMLTVNSGEGNVEKFFDHCQTSQALFDRLLIPTVESVLEDHGFVDTFEESRDNFKEYKRLKEMIAENERILDELKVYMDVHHRLHEKETALKEEKGRLKGIADAAEEARKSHEASQAVHDGEWAAYASDHDRHRLKEASLLIAEQEETVTEADGERQELAEELSQLEASKEAAERQYYSMKVAGLKEALQKAKAAFEQGKKELKAREDHEAIEDLEERFTAVKAELHGLFDGIRDALTAEKQAEERRKAGLMEEHEALTDEEKRLRKQRDKRAGEIAEMTGETKQMTTQMNKIRQELLANPETESVEGLNKSWTTKLSELEDERVHLSEEQKHLSLKQDEQASARDDAAKQLEDTRVSLGQTKTEYNQVLEEHERVRQELMDAKPVWRGLESIYDQDAKILSQLQGEISRAVRQRDDKRRAERVHRRLADDYGDQDLFFADPEMNRLLTQWQNRWHLLETGFSYLQNVGKTDDPTALRYPYWAATLITTAGEKEGLKERIQETAGKLLYPVFVLSTDDVNVLLQDEHVESGRAAVILPAHWTENLDAGQFAAWKEAITNRAQEMEDALTEAEKELRFWEDLEQTVHGFLMRFPFEGWQEVEDRLARLKEEEQRMQKRLRAATMALSELSEKQAHNRERQKDVDTASAEIGRRLEKAQEYGRLKRACSERQDEQAKLMDLQEHDERALRRLERKRHGIERDLSGVNETIGDLNTRIVIEVREHGLYQRVKDTPAMPPRSSRATLEERFKALEREELQLTRVYEAVKLSFEQAKKDRDRLEAELKEAREDAPSLDETMSWPFNGKDEQTKWKRETQRLGEACVSFEKRYLTKERAVDQLKWKLGETVKQFGLDFPGSERVVFERPLKDIAKEHEREGEALKRRKNALDAETERLTGEGRDLHEVETKLRAFDDLYQFSDPAIASKPLADEEAANFAYQRLYTLEKQNQRLRQAIDAVDQEKKRVSQGKSRFLHFIRENVKDPRLRHRADEGVTKKDSYAEMLEFESYMEKSLRQANRIAETNLQSQGKQVEDFISRVHGHLKQLAGELRQIPKKTRVKTGEDWKTIFTFNVPEWEEEEGIERIRAHFDWIMDELEKDSFKDSDGQENTAKMRQSLETWLHAKQLLRRVINEKALKVSCRKVKNNNDITSRSFSWEESNRWSGGEKWSKNMTLFLGIQNYVAEKKQPVPSIRGRSRAVILDNPFGQASSDHVLSPVFFIAEKLGFQILTLTAHTEGKFLGDYFPVIYSCRLRTAANTDMQMVDKEKRIQYAYFKDHDPASLERLGETSQGTLF